MSRFTQFERLESRTLFASFTAANVAELTAAINVANASTQADTITLAAGATFSLTARISTANGGTGLPAIAAKSGSLTVFGNGGTIERIEAPDTLGFRLFDVAAGASLALKNLTLQGGAPVAGVFTSASNEVQGGAIHNQGELILEGVTIQNNTVRGADTNFGPTPNGQAFGGGVYSTGTLTASGCIIRNNFAIGGGGKGAFGGGVYIGGGTCSINSSIVTSNTAQGGAGGGGFGGGLYAVGASVGLHNVTITTNAAAGGRGHRGNSGQGIGGGIYIAPAASVGLDAFTLDHCRRNKAGDDGKDIFGSYTLIL